MSARAILEITDGVAAEPVHQPVERDFNKNLFADVEPLEWPTLCGSKGYVYEHGALAALGFRTECFDCLKVLQDNGPKEQTVKQTVLRTKRITRRRPLKRRVCEQCGKKTSNKSKRFCMSCYRSQPGAKCGTRSSYVTGCRCELCTRAEADYSRDRKRRAKAAYLEAQRRAA